MEAIVLALGASLTWGLADFYGPLKGRTLGALRVLFYVQLSGLITIAIVVAIRGKGPESWVALLAVPAAISGTLGLYAYYRGVAVGRDQHRGSHRRCRGGHSGCRRSRER